MRQRVAVVGMGEVGKPLGIVLGEMHDVVAIDVPNPPLESVGPIDVLHVCYPFEIEDFVGETARYVAALQPGLTVVDSTVEVGTTRRIHERTGAPIVHSPVRGKHARMVEDMRRYVKFIGGIDRAAAEAAAAHFEAAGLGTRVLASPEATELAKLTETSYFGLLIAWAQQVERYADLAGADYEEIVSFFDEIDFFPPVRYFPGVIGGHCVLPNLDILDKLAPADITRAIRTSNEAKKARRTGA